MKNKFENIRFKIHTEKLHSKLADGNRDLYQFTIIHLTISRRLSPITLSVDRTIRYE